MNGVQCYELFGGIALKGHAFFPMKISLFYKMTFAACMIGQSNGYKFYFDRCKVMSIMKSITCSHSVADYYLKSLSFNISRTPVILCAEK